MQSLLSKYNKLTPYFVFFRHRQVYGDQQETDSSVPPKPPAPVFPHKSALKQPIRKQLPPSADVELTEQNVRRHLTGSSEFVSTGDLNAAQSRKREILTLHIPVNDTEKAGLGINVKGKITSNNSSSTGSSNGSGSGGITYLGVFVKSVINGGAASLDGRLRMNDQLLSVNEVSLLGQSNEEAMETLSRTIKERSLTHPGTITVTVSRRVGSRPHSQMFDGAVTAAAHDDQPLYGVSSGSTVANGSGDSGSGVSVNGSFNVSHTRSVSSTSEQSGKTVIYLSSEKLEDHHPSMMLGGNNVNKNNGLIVNGSASSSNR